MAWYVLRSLQLQFSDLNYSHNASECKKTTTEPIYICRLSDKDAELNYSNHLNSPQSNSSSIESPTESLGKEIPWKMLPIILLHVLWLIPPDLLFFRRFCVDFLCVFAFGWIIQNEIRFRWAKSWITKKCWENTGNTEKTENIFRNFVKGKPSELF